MEWTREQKRIIELRKSNILVSAAAGSGKTAVLVERIIDLIKEGDTNIDEFLVVTFTNSAAGGMRQKIQKALLAIAKEDKNNKHIRRQLNLINKSQITTIHSFCLEVVRKNFHYLGLDPNFRIGDMNEMDILLNESLDEVLEKAYKENKESFISLVESFTNHRGDRDLASLILQVFYFLKSLPEPYGWLRENIEKLKMSEEDFLKSFWYEEVKRYIKSKIKGAISIVDIGLGMCNKPQGPDIYIDNLEADLKALSNLEESINHSFESFTRRIETIKWSTLKTFRPSDNPHVDLNIQVEIKDRLRKQYKDLIKNLKDQFIYGDLDYYLKDISHMYEPMVEFYNIIVDLDDTYRDKKLRKGVLDFNDLEHFTYQIFKNEEINKLYKDKYSFIFIDEYQDSNSLQEAIINKIKRNDNLFMVGDVKQSIYRFRLADPHIFNYKYRSFEKDRIDLGEDQVERLIELNKNFRSRKEILKGTNFIFEKIMSKDFGEIDYNENVSLIPGNKDFISNEDIELIIIDKSINEGLEDTNIDYEISSMKDAEFESIYVTKRIKELIKEEVFDTKEKRMRPIEYKDIVILLRTVANWSSIFEENFAKENIPFYFDGGSGYFNTIEVQVLVNLLRLIDNINQDIPLLSFLRSPMANFTSGELVEIRKKAGDSFLDSARAFIEDDKASIEVREKLSKVFDQIAMWSHLSLHMDLHDLIWKLVIDTGYYDFVGLQRNGKLRQANLRLLADKASAFEENSQGLFKFIRYIEKQLGENDKNSSAKIIGENNNVVRLMTVHSSKGLEFPLVFLCGLNKNFNLRDSYSKIMVHKDFGLGPKYIDHKARIEKETLVRLVMAEKTKIENFSEEMRILYVAMTRAIDRLIMVASVSDLENSLKKWKQGYSDYFLYSSKSYLDWISSCFFKGMEIEDLNDFLENNRLDNWYLRKINASDLLEENRTTNSRPMDKLRKLGKLENKKFSKEIENRLKFNYPYRDLIEIPSKVSATGIKAIMQKDHGQSGHKLTNIEPLAEFSKESLKNKRISGLEVGNLLHLFMEKFDIRGDLSKEGLRKQIDNISIKNNISKEEKALIIASYLSRIDNFYKSNVGIRMVQSNNIQREVPFLLKKNLGEIIGDTRIEEDVLIQGIIDCYFEEDGEIVIIDYKTDWSDEEKIDQIVSDYKDQIYTYRDALERITKKNVKESYLYLFSIGKAIKID